MPPGFAEAFSNGRAISSTPAAGPAGTFAVNPLIRSLYSRLDQLRPPTIVARDGIAALTLLSQLLARRLAPNR